jgi:LmbE family N-acetylglucosaminyl deacetylase/GT2 family glycosyltransferase
MDEASLIPFATTDLTGRRVLVLAPHPDDESLGCGGAIILHRDAGDPVKIVVLTDGGEGRRAEGMSRADYVELREQETVKAAQILGTADVEFWRLPDRQLEREPFALGRLVALLEQYRPTLVYVPSPVEIHPDHRAAARLAWMALQGYSATCQVAYYEVSRPLDTNTLVDISPVVERKRAACDVYASQLASHPYTDCAIGLNRFRALTVSSTCRFVEALLVVDGKQIATRPAGSDAPKPLLRPLGAGHGAQALVSVVIRTRDRPNLLRDAIASVAAQTWRNLEVVVVNDGGSDVEPVVDAFMGTLSIRHHAVPASQGRSAAGNLGVELSRGKYVNFLDDDDVLYPDHVERLVSFLERTGEDLAYSDCERGFYRCTDSTFELQEPKSPFYGVDYDRDRLYVSNFIPIMTAMFSRRLWDRAGQMDPALAALEDWDLWLRMSEHVPFHRVPGITAEYRMFASHPIDDAAYLAVRQKHLRYWSVDNYIANLWPRVAVMVQENAEMRTALARTQAEIARTHTELEARRAELRAIRASTSWRVSLPVRWMGNLIARTTSRPTTFGAKHAHQTRGT